MTDYSFIANASPDYIDALYAQYREAPGSIDEKWQAFFKGVEFSGSASNGHQSSELVSDKEVSVIKLINGYRARGHLISKTNPVRQRRQHKADLELDYFGLSESDLSSEYAAGKELKIGPATLENILAHLKKTYCGHIGVEFTHCSNEVLRKWLYAEMEPIANDPVFSSEEKRDILAKLDASVTFENFLQTKYVGKKRFSLEGLEAFIPALDAAVRTAAGLGAKECVLGMAHRGRLNVLVNVFEKSTAQVFAEFEENNLPEDFERGGDVKYHLGRSADITTPEGHPMHLSLLPNPSHLEAIGPILQGVVYAKKEHLFNQDQNAILPIVVHGDAAISGQGVNYEMANMYKLDGFDVGGSIHIVLNNQIGFTANYKEGRSSIYCTDLAKVTDSPVFHVNADDPLAVVHAMKLAVKIRQEFNIDVYVDILGYRRYGHNEGDEPRFTQPILYESIAKHPNVYDVYLAQLIAEGIISKDAAVAQQKAIKDHLQAQLDAARAEGHEKEFEKPFKRVWHQYRKATDDDFTQSIETGVAADKLDTVAKALVHTPDTLSLFSKTKKQLNARNKMLTEKQQVDWALAELLAYGSLLIEGHGVRLAGQDARRGTFSHRHAVIKDNQSEDLYIPLNHIQDEQSALTVYNTFLSEYAAMGFEYGYATTMPNSLVLWEAQFGDFSNGAQIVIDQFLSSSEYKWNRMCGLVLLLPHGYEGQGPEHSSARMERYLQLCAQNNMYVCNVTNPANFFHLLRRQVKNPFRKPLVVFSPKSLLRHPEVVSPVSALNTGAFQEVLFDLDVPSASVKRVVLCTGKLYYDLKAERDETERQDIALVRLEQLYPLPLQQLNTLKETYAHVTDWVWAQEEPENMGAWTFILHHLRDWNLRVISRLEGASPSTGSNKFHIKAQRKLVETVFAS